MNQDNSPEHEYDCPNFVKFELQEKNPYYTTLKSGIHQSIPSSYQEPTTKSCKVTEVKTTPEHKTQSNKVMAVVVVVTCINILLALCSLVAGAYSITSLRTAEIAPAVGDVNASTDVQMLFRDVNATQYQLMVLEDDMSELIAAHANTTSIMTPGEVDYSKDSYIL